MKYGIANVKAKVGGSGGADLNLAYGLTPPSDTTKIWVKCEEPSKVKIEANRELVVSSDENAKVMTEYSLSGSNDITPSYNVGSFKLGNYIYFTGKKINGVTVTSVEVARINLTTNEINKITLTSSGGIVTCIWTDGDYIYALRCSSTASGTNYLHKLDLELTSATSISGGQYKGSSYGWCYLDGVLYRFPQANTTINNNGTFSVVKYNPLNFVEQGTLTITNKTGLSIKTPAPYTQYYNSSMYCKKGNKIYFLNAIYDVKSYGQLLYVDLETNEVKDTGLNINCGDGIGCSYMTNQLYGDKIFCWNLMKRYYQNSTNLYAYLYDVIIIDLSTYQVITLLTSYTSSSTGNTGCIDENTGDFYIFTSGSKYLKISNIYSLEENTLDLYYDTLSSLNIKLMDTPTITMDAPINHAWLGDSNDIAQPVDFYYYKNSLWWGVNCLGYTQLKNCVISASDVAIDLANATSDTQTITITPTWANETGVITTSVATSDDTLATATLSGDSLTINALAVGTPTITISVVDEYGTTYTKSITITITNSGA